MYKILSVLTAINVQTKSDINLGGQGMVKTNQGVAYKQTQLRNKSFIVELDSEIIKIWR